MANLLEETTKKLEINNKTIEDIKWVGTNKHYVDIDKFLKLANTKYDNGYGSPEVAENLLIVGQNWWLERHEYDGSEWWEYKETPKRPNNKLELKALTIGQAKKQNIDVCCGWETLERINGLEDDEQC